MPVDTRSEALAWERVTFLALLSSSVCLAQFVIPDGGLPEAKVGEVTITFTPNGAFVASRDGIQFMDGGLGFATKGHERWGEQIRGSKPPDTSLLSKPEGDREMLIFFGVLRDTHGKGVLKFQQQVSVEDEGLHFEYLLHPIEPIGLDRLGITCHSPVRRLAGKRLEFLPGFLDLPFPIDFPRADGGGYVGRAVSRRVIIARDSPYEVALSADKPFEWMVFDDREWQLSIYRVWLNFAAPRKGVPAEGLKLAFDVAFGDHTALLQDEPDDQGKQAAPEPAPLRAILSQTQPSLPTAPIRKTGVTWNPDGSLTIWDLGTRVAEVSLVADTGDEPGQTPTFQSHFAASEAEEIRDVAGTGHRGDLTFRGTLGRSASTGLLQYRQHVRQTGQGFKIQYTLAATDALVKQLKETPNSFRAGIAVFLRSDAFSDESVSSPAPSILSAASCGALRIDAVAPGAAPWTASTSHKWSSNASLLEVGDIPAWTRFCSLLYTSRLEPRSPSFLIWRLLCQETRRQIGAVARGRVEQKDPPQETLDRLNTVLDCMALYQEGCFPNVQALLQVEGLLRKGRARADLPTRRLQRLNRLLFEAAYQTEITASTNAQLHLALLPWPTAEPVRATQPAGKATDPPDALPKPKSNDSPAPEPLRALTFELDLRLVPTAQAETVAAAPPQPVRPTSSTRATRPGRNVGWAAPTTGLSSKAVLILPDDTSSRGDWQGKYGTYAYILCGRYSPRSLEGGIGWPIKHRIYTGNPSDPARKWVSSLDASRIRSTLWNPIEQNRQFSVWDDHGEVYPRGKGPDLFIDLEVPKGPFCLGLYFMESDWIQYRAYTVSIFAALSPDRHGLPTVPSHASRPDQHGLPTVPPDAPTPDQRGLLTVPPTSSHRLLARTTVHDFFDGTYKRFLVLGPQELTIKIARNDSTNATLAGLFLDRAPTLLPIPTTSKLAGDIPVPNPSDPGTSTSPESRGKPLQRVTPPAKLVDDVHVADPSASGTSTSQPPRGKPLQRVTSPSPSGRVALPPDPSTPVGSSPQTPAILNLIDSYNALRRLQTQAQADFHELVFRREALDELRDKTELSLKQNLPPADLAAALWMLWQCQEQLFAPKHTTSELLEQWTQATNETSNRQRRVALLRATADRLFALADLDASELVHDSYVEALAQSGTTAEKRAGDTVENALKDIVLQYFSLNADTRYGLRKWQQYLAHIASHCGKDEAVKRLRAAAEQTYRLAQERHTESRGSDPSGYLLPIAALRQIRTRHTQTALTADDQKLLARAAKHRLFFLWGLNDYVQEHETLLTHYPNAPGMPESYLHAIEAHLILAQQTNDYTRALELARTLSTQFPSTPEAASAQLQIISDYYLYRRKYAEAASALTELEKRDGAVQLRVRDPVARDDDENRLANPARGRLTPRTPVLRSRDAQGKPSSVRSGAGTTANGTRARQSELLSEQNRTNIAHLREQIFTHTHKKLLPVPGSRGKPLQRVTSTPAVPSPHPPTILDLLQSYESLRQHQAQSPDTFYAWSQETGAIRDLAAEAQSLLKTTPLDDARAKALWILWQCQDQLGAGQRESPAMLRQYLDEIKATCTRMRRLRLLRDVDRHLFESRNFDALDVAIDDHLDALGGSRRRFIAQAELKRFALRYYAADAWVPHGLRRWQQYLDRVLADHPKDRAAQVLRRAAQEASSAVRRKSRAQPRSGPDAHAPTILALKAIRAHYGDQALTDQDRRLLKPANIQHPTFNVQHPTDGD